MLWEEPNDLLDKQAELENCTFVKTILMIFIVLCHSMCFWNGDWFTQNPILPAPEMGYLAKWGGEFHVYTFTLISGYIFYYLKQEKGKYGKFIPFAKNKIRRLLLPYIVIALTWIIPVSLYFFKYDFYKIVYSYFLAISPSQLWFLVMLFNVFVISWLFVDFFEKNLYYSAMLVLGFYGIGLIGELCFPNVLQIWTTCRYMFFFWMGFSIRQYGSKWIRRIPAVIWIIVDIILFLLMSFIGEKDHFLFKVIHMGLRFSLNIVGALMAFCVLQKLANSINWKKCKMFCFLSDCSMIIYLFHQQIIYFTITWLNGKIHPYLNAMINFMFAITFSLFISYIIMNLKTIRILFGGK